MPSEPHRRARRRLPLEWLGILPFAIFAFLFLILPTLRIVTGAFQSPEGGFTFQNLLDLNPASNRNAYRTSLQHAVFTAPLR